MEKEKAATDGTSDGTITKPFLIDDGHCVVEFDATTDAHSNLIMFCIRGVGSRQGVFDGIKTAEDFLTKSLNDSEVKTHSRCFAENDVTVQMSILVNPGISKEKALSVLSESSHRFYLELAETLNNKP